MNIIRKALLLTRGLRFRLAASYVFFFALLLIVLGMVFRQTLSSTFAGQVDETLKEDFEAAKGYLRELDTGPDWVYDKKDPDETYAVERLRRIFMLADTEGHMLYRSSIYGSIGVDTPAEIKTILKSGQPVNRLRWDSQGNTYMIRSGVLVLGNFKYYLAIGRQIDQNQRVLRDFTRNYFAVVPIVILLSSLLGWFMAGRALGPVNSVAETAQRITHSNLNMQIPRRGAQDELDRLIDAFNHMMERLSASFEQIRQFSTDVSHELRTPLTVIRGQLEVALFTAKTAEQYRDAMVNALEDVERLSNIVRALLMLSQAESGQLVLQKTDLDFADLVRDFVDQFQITAEVKGTRLITNLPERCPLHADRVQIERLVSNLLSNAIKYTPDGGEIRVEVAQAGSQVRFIVDDTGVGIAPDHIPHIFDRFYRVPSSDPEKGLGLGLSFVAWIVKAHGGTIEVDSVLGRGTRFSVLLPAGPFATVAEPPASIAAEQLH